MSHDELPSMRGRDMSEVPHPLVPDTLARLGACSTHARGACPTDSMRAPCTQAPAASTCNVPQPPEASVQSRGQETDTRSESVAFEEHGCHSLLQKVVLVHLNHTNPLWQQGCKERKWVEAMGCKIGSTGMDWEL